MSKINSDSLIKRLVLIKYLFITAEEQSQQQSASAGLSVLAFHDCVEMLLVLIAHHKNKKVQDHFLDYWHVIPELPYKGNMENLNNVRISLKHYATLPNNDEIDRCCADVKLFLNDSIKHFWNIDFDDLLLSSLISFNEVKEDMEKAETFMAESKIYESLEEAKTAFIKLLSIYDSSKELWYDSIFNIGVKVGNDYQKFLREYKGSTKWYEQVTQTVNAARDTLKITSLGIDYKKYILFNFITPRVTVGCNSDGIIYLPESKSDFEARRNVGFQDCQFCISFVVDCALKLQEFNFDINRYLKSNS